MSTSSERKEKFFKIYDANEANVYRACAYLLEDLEAAEKVAYQVFTEFYDYFETVKPGMEKAYLITAARKLCNEYKVNAALKNDEKK